MHDDDFLDLVLLEGARRDGPLVLPWPIMGNFAQNPLRTNFQAHYEEIITFACLHPSRWQMPYKRGLAETGRVQSSSGDIVFANPTSMDLSVAPDAVHEGKAARVGSR